MTDDDCARYTKSKLFYYVVVFFSSITNDILSTNFMRHNKYKCFVFFLHYLTATHLFEETKIKLITVIIVLQYKKLYPYSLHLNLCFRALFSLVCLYVCVHLYFDFHNTYSLDDKHALYF